MLITKLTLKNWRNFKKVDVSLRERVYVIGPNASGKSNLLDVFRFLRDVAKPEGGGLQKAVKDRGDIDRLTQTHLKQINTNKAFREIADFFANVTYLHLVPQLLKYADQLGGYRLEDDPFGQAFLERIAKTPEKTRNARLSKIENVLRVCVPNMRNLRFVRDKATGTPHLEALYEHWRPDAGWQREDQFSDGTLRLLGIMVAEALLPKVRPAQVDQLSLFKP